MTHRDTDPLAATALGALAPSSLATDQTLLATTVASARPMPTAGDPDAQAQLERGALVGRYVILSKLGAGGMGVVYAAYDPELDRKIALKLLHPRLAADAEPATAHQARARLVREAQALAKLNHPHIVAVHDVGEHAHGVWLAMEYVEGETLAAWMKQRRPWPDVLEVLIPAARGLAAAHAAGLVHRDIKPDNIMVGADGRVRVMDLGLARALDDRNSDAPVAPDAPLAASRDLAPLSAHVTRTGSVMGTPAYMSPEQFEGRPVDARADVFSFCVTLWEALMGERPFAGSTMFELATHVLAGNVRPVPRDPLARRVPGWLRRVCLQGLAVQPERRFASMQALLDALAKGRIRARMRAWAIGGTALAALGAFAALHRHHDRAERIAACDAAGAGIDGVWNDEARARVRAGILATGVSYAPVTADKVMPFLDKQAEDWRRHRSRACLQADLERTLDAEQLDRAVWCLDERRMDLAALIAEMSRADATVVQRAVTAAAGLQPVSPCTDPQVLAALPSPPPPEVRAKADAVRTQLSRASTLLTAGKYPDGLERVRTALADAEALGWPPMIAAARALEGDLLAKSGSYADAEAASVRAYMDAAKVHAWDVAATAATGLVWNVGYRQARHAEGKVWAGHAEVAVLFAADTLGLREARRLHTLAILHMSTGAFADARALSERALAIYEKVLGPDHPDVAAALHLLATAHMNAGAFADAKALLDRALVIREHALGPEHPEVAACLETLAALQHHAGARAEAKALFERALAIREKVFGPDHPDVAASLNNLAVMQQKSGAYAEASALLERALAIREQALGPDHPEVATSLNNLATVHRHTGAYADAKALLGRVLAIREKALGREHPAVALALVNLAEVHQATGAHADAGALYERALAIHEKAHGPDHPNVAIALAGLGNLALAQNRPADALRRLERAVAIFDGHAGVQEGELAARFSLARALVRSGGDRARALAEARKAADGLRQAGEGAAMQLAEVEAFLAEHESPP